MTGEPWTVDRWKALAGELNKAGGILLEFINIPEMKGLTGRHLKPFLLAYQNLRIASSLVDQIIGEHPHAGACGRVLDIREDRGIPLGRGPRLSVEEWTVWSDKARRLASIFGEAMDSVAGAHERRAGRILAALGQATSDGWKGPNRLRALVREQHPASNGDYRINKLFSIKWKHLSNDVPISSIGKER